MTFDEWLYEVENSSLRLERLMEEVPTANSGRLIKWLEAAYKMGYDHRNYEMMDDGK